MASFVKMFYSTLVTGYPIADNGGNQEYTTNGGVLFVILFIVMIISASIVFLYKKLKKEPSPQYYRSNVIMRTNHGKSFIKQDDLTAISPIRMRSPVANK